MLQKEITIVFPSLHSLMGFVREYRINYLDLDSQSFTLICSGEGLDATVIQEKYGGRLESSSTLNR